MRDTGRLLLTFSIWIGLLILTGSLLTSPTGAIAQANSATVLGVTLVLGGWVVVAPWVLGYRGTAATNDLILGLAIAAVSVIRLTGREVGEAPAAASAMRGMGAMTATAMRDMAAALARMSDAERRAMLGERLRMFAEMPDAERKHAMAAIWMAWRRCPTKTRRGCSRPVSRCSRSSPRRSGVP